MNEQFTVKRFVDQNRDRNCDITTAEVKGLESFKKMTDEEAAELVNVIKTFTVIVFNSCCKETPAGVIQLNADKVKNKAA